MLNSFQETLEIEKEKVKAEATKIGIAEGRAEGRAEERAAIIRLMAANGMDDEYISKILEMDLDEVKLITSRALTAK